MVVKNVSERRGSLGSNSLGRSNDFLALTSLACLNVRPDVGKKKTVMLSCPSRKRKRDGSRNGEF